MVSAAEECPGNAWLGADALEQLVRRSRTAVCGLPGSRREGGAPDCHPLSAGVLQE